MAATDNTLPHGMQVSDNGFELEIVWKWPRKSLLEIAVYLFFVWMITHEMLRFDNLDWTGPIEHMTHNFLNEPFPLNLILPLFASIALSMLYSIALAILNSTRISASRSKVAVRHGPLPWLGNKDVESSSIKQIFSEKKLHGRAKHGGELPPTYDLCAAGHNGEKIKLLTGLKLTQEQAAYFEQKLERYLGIKDDLAHDSQRSIDASVTQVQRGAQLTISRNWFTPQKTTLLIFAIIWSVFAGGFSWMWLTRGGSQPLFPIEPEPAHGLLVIFATVGMLLLYTAAAGLLNRTELVVGRDKISVRHGPLPWAGNGEFPLSALKTLKVEISMFREGNNRTRFDLFALMRDGKRKKLLGGIETREQANGVRQEIEQYLKAHSALGYFRVI